MRPTPSRVFVCALVAVLCLGLLACAGAGRQFDRTHVTDIRKGVQDEDQIRAWFGSPVRVEALSGHPAGCAKRWTYVHAFSSYGGAKTSSKSLVVDFDADGLVCDHAYVEN